VIVALSGQRPRDSAQISHHKMTQHHISVGLRKKKLIVEHSTI
jgi:hypothetical protein